MLNYHPWNCWIRACGGRTYIYSLTYWSWASALQARLGHNWVLRSNLSKAGVAEIHILAGSNHLPVFYPMKWTVVRLHLTHDVRVYQFSVIIQLLKHT
jgi:hypothetical protein